MELLKKYYSILLLILFFFVIVPLIVNFIPTNPDMYFHLALGNVISHHGLIQNDAVSQSGQHKQFLHYEWLFQLILYWFTSVFGFSSWRILIWIISAIQFGIIYLLLHRIFKVNTILSLCLILFYFLLTINFFIARPQIFASTFFITEIFLILLYLKNNKYFLYLLLPLTYLWSNIHSSVILSPLFCLFYFLVYLFVSHKNNSLQRKTLILGVYTIGTFIASILPPQGFTSYQYVYLLLFSNQRDLITKFITEWNPLITYMPIFVLYISMIVLILGIFFIIIYKNKLFNQVFWVIPLLILIPLGFSSLRFVFYGYFALIVILGWLLAQINYHKLLPSIKLTLAIIIAIIFVIQIWIVNKSLQNANFAYPEYATDFIQQEHLQGNMFNQLVYGGYLEYRLYPQEKVFIDGRSDIFLCCELPDYYFLVKNLYLNNQAYDFMLNQFFTKYNISYTVLVMQNDNLASKISSVLENDPQWKLVFWDDKSEIFVKQDGKNNPLLAQLGANAATPFEQVPYKKGEMKEAYDEYVRMTQVHDSALTRNMLGIILYQQKKIHNAEDQFIKAIQLNKSAFSSYYDLAVIVQNQGQFTMALQLYKTSLSLNPNQINIYMNMGNIYKAMNDFSNAKASWNQGLKYAATEEQKQEITQMINTSP